MLDSKDDPPIAITRIPQVSGPLRDRTLELTADPSGIVRRSYAALVELDSTYARLAPSFKQDILEHLDYCARLWFNSLLEGTFPAQSHLEIIQSTGRRRVHQGLALASLLRAFRVGAREIWSEFLDLAQQDAAIRDQLLFDVSRYLLEYFDVLSQTIAQAYLDEQYQRLRWRDSLRYELASIVFQSPDDVAGFRKTAEALGLDSTLPYIAVALNLDRPEQASSRFEGELDRLAVAASRHFKCKYENLVRVLHRGRLVIWIPCIRGDTVVVADRKMVPGALALLSAAPQILAIGIGLLHQDPSGWAISVNEAFQALDFGLREQTGKKVYLYSAIALDESVRTTDNALRYLDSLLERLAAEPDLLVTLQTYFDQQQRRKLAAEVLGIHPNTLNNRLQRIESLLGAQLEDVSWVAKLHVALRLRQRSEPRG